MQRQQLLAYLHTEMRCDAYTDYCPNGLQVEGRAEIHKIVTGVSASLALIEAAINANADALLVHHGIFWGSNPCKEGLTGWLKKRVARLLSTDLNLLAYHLPLDAHPQWGNNAQLAKVLGFDWVPPSPSMALPARTTSAASNFGPQDLGFLGRCTKISGHALQQHISEKLGRSVLLVGPADTEIERVAWCTGGAQNWFEAAIAAGAQAFITGEISEPQTHLAREYEVPFFACGHHATERYGIQALGEHLAQHFGIEHCFIDLDNPA